MEYTEKQIKQLLTDIYNGDISQEELPEDLYLAIANYFKEALYKGFGGSLEDFKMGTPNAELLEDLRNNIYMFSGAKTYTQVGELASAVADSSSFNDFFDKAQGIYDQYNKTWAEAEYNTCIGQATQARQWNDIQSQKDVLPLLRYNAVMDPNTSEICAPLNGITLPVDDPLWNDYSPLNHFNCRCILEQVEEGKISTPEEVDPVKKELDENVQPEFKMNPGKDGYIFSPEHPYFEVARGDKDFAKRNFDLNIPDND